MAPDLLSFFSQLVLERDVAVGETLKDGAKRNREEARAALNRANETAKREEKASARFEGDPARLGDCIRKRIPRSLRGAPEVLLVRKAEPVKRKTKRSGKRAT